MKTETREERIQKFCDFLDRSPRERAIKNHCKKEIDWILSQKKKNSDSIKITTARTHFTSYRNEIKDCFIPVLLLTVEREMKQHERAEKERILTASLSIDQTTAELAKIRLSDKHQRYRGILKKSMKDPKIKAALIALDHLKIPQEYQDLIEMKKTIKLSEPEPSKTLLAINDATPEHKKNKFTSSRALIFAFLDKHPNATNIELYNRYTTISKISVRVYKADHKAQKRSKTLHVKDIKIKSCKSDQTKELKKSFPLQSKWKNKFIQNIQNLLLNFFHLA